MSVCLSVCLSLVESIRNPGLFARECQRESGECARACVCVFARARVLTDKSGRCLYLLIIFYWIGSCFAQHLQVETVTQSPCGRVQVGMAKYGLSSPVDSARSDACRFSTSSWVTPLALLSAARFQAIDMAAFARSACLTKH